MHELVRLQSQFKNLIMHAFMHVDGIRRVASQLEEDHIQPEVESVGKDQRRERKRAKVVSFAIELVMTYDHVCIQLRRGVWVS